MTSVGPESVELLYFPECPHVEAARGALRSAFQALGVPASAVAPLVPGDNSRETVRSAVLQVGRGPRLLAVTSAYHARRVLDEGRRQGLILGAACPSRSPDVTTPQIHRARVAVDVVGVLVYALPKPWALVLRSAFGRWRPALSRAVGGRRAWNEPAYPQ